MHIKISITRKPEMHLAARSGVYNNIIQQPGDDICFLGQRIKMMTAKCV